MTRPTQADTNLPAETTVPARNGCIHWGVAIALLCVQAAGTHPATAAEPIGVEVPGGFQVTLFADDDLAHDIYSMTIDSHGRVVVSGAGYVKILVDEDGDGRADTAKEFANGPKVGSQGMYFYGNDLLCTGDGGLVRYRDINGDDRADGPPEVFLKMQSGGEHDGHAVRRGPDGWWYLNAGNYCKVDKRYNTTKTSPVAEPTGGVIYRLSPDLSQGEVVADGYRNAYDFDFGTQGDLFTFDSDGERDLSLPWYRPTRVFHAVTGTNAGWVSQSWKRPNEFIDMAPVVGDFGRGSPSGVVTYRHTHLHPEVQGALFVLDWTYGRVLALPLAAKGSSYSTAPIEFMRAKGDNGFAPTDIEVGPDGALYVAVGGRGTRGGVYRITAKDRPLDTKWFSDQAPTLPEEKLAKVLTAPQPLSSWSRSVWEPLAEQLGGDAFTKAAIEESRPTSQRIRAIEILVEKFKGPDSDLVAKLTKSSDAVVRARTAWAIGRTDPASPNATLIGPLLQDDEPVVVLAALEAILAADPAIYAKLVEPIAVAVGSDDRTIRLIAAKVLMRADPDTYYNIAAAAQKFGWPAAVVLAHAYAARHEGADPYTIDIAFRVLKSEQPASLKLEATRLLQLALGDVGPTGNEAESAFDPVFDGYSSPLVLDDDPISSAKVAPGQPNLKTLHTELTALYPTGDIKLDRQLARVIAMAQPESANIVSKLLSRITKQSHPTDDLHQLICLARMVTATWSESERTQVADAILQIEPKLKARSLAQDSNWDDRITELYFALSTHDAELPMAMLRHSDFGSASHVQFLSMLPPTAFEEALDTFTRRVTNGGEEYEWNTDLVFLLSESQNEKILDIVRSKFDDYGLRPAVLMALAGKRNEVDRPLLIKGLESSQTDVLKECLTAMALMQPGKTPAEQVALVRALRRLGYKEGEIELRDKVAELLIRNTGQTLGYTLGQTGDPQQKCIDLWAASVKQAFPEEYASQVGTDETEVAQLQSLLAEADWSKGDVARGESLFKSRACVQCHGGSRALGPDLVGVANRFSKHDLFTAIAIPNQDVSPRYQTTTVVTSEGKTYTGLIVYEAVDGIVLRDAQNRTYRIEAENIEVQKKLSTSLMPAGLLKDLKHNDIADLYAYLRSLNLRTAKTEGIQTK